MRIHFLVAAVATSLFTGSVHGQMFERTDFTGPGPSYFTRYHWADFNGDGSYDILEVDSYSSGILHISDGAGFTSTALDFDDLYLAENRTVLKDVDGDGDVDILGAQGNSFVILNYDGISSFSLINTGIKYTDADYGNVYWVDIDGDQILDVIHGRKVFLNRKGIYAESRFILPEYLSNMVFDDINADGLSDIVAGDYESYDGTQISVLLNQGEGNFSASGIVMPVNSLKSKTIALIDADRDGDIDIFATDLYGRGFIFKNNLADAGLLTFVATQIFPNTSHFSAVAGDLDSDGLEDLVLTGSSELTVLRNTSSGTTISFSPETHEISLDVSYFSANLLDIDNDNDLDIHIKGSYWNGSDNLFFLKTGTPGGSFPSTPTSLSAEIAKNRTLSWNSVPGLLYNVELKRNGAIYLPSFTSSSGKLLVPGQSNLLRTGTMILRGLPAGTYEWRVQTLDPSGRASAFSSTNTFQINPEPLALTLDASEFTKIRLCWSYNGAGTPSFAVFRGSETGAAVEIAQVNSGDFCYEDNAVPPNQEVSYFVLAVDNGVYSAPSNTVSHYSSLFVKSAFGLSDPNIIAARCFPADFDMDGDYDLEFIGRVGFFDNNFLMKNNGEGSFSPHGALLTADAIHPTYTESPGPRDMDNDGDPDMVVVTGEEGYSWQSVTVFLNNNGTFVKGFETSSYLGVMQLGIEDLNNDGRPDLLFSHVIGNGSGNPYRYQLLHQTADGNFIDSRFTFTTEETSTLAFFRFADLNGDGFIDILWSDSEKQFTEILINEGGMTFSKMASTLPVTHQMGVADYNGDGIMDIMVQGNEGMNLYFGAGNFTFTEPKVIPVGPLNGLPEFVHADVDLNGWTDVLLSDGYRGSVILNNGNGSFKNSDVGLQSDWGTWIAIADFENDGDIDIVKTGNDGQHQGLNYIYRNQVADIQGPNQPPAPPGMISTTYSLGETAFTWPSSTDDRTPSNLLSYNLKIVDSSGKVWLSAETNDDGTFRRRLGPGNSGYGISQTLNNLPAGIYNARVQALDASFALSAWSQDNQFTIHEGPSSLAIARILLNKVELTWNGSPYAETAVIVQRKTPGTVWEIVAELGAGTNSYIDSNLEYNQLYQYRVFESSGAETTAMSEIAEWNTDMWVIEDTEIANLFGSMDVADFTGDGKMDMVMNGGMIYNGYTEDITRATFENTSGGFVKNDVTGSELTHTAAINFTDLNGDFSPDIYQHGYIWDSGYRTEAFLNNGNKTFSSTSNIFTTGTYSIQSYFDFDMDNDLDIVALKAGTYPTVREVFQNNGHGNYSSVETTTCTICPNDAAVADFDQDGDEDVIRYIGGNYSLLMNTPEGLVATGQSFPAYEKMIAVTDYNNDGLPDVVLMTNSYYGSGKIFKNLGLTDGGNAPNFEALPLNLSSGDQSLLAADFDHDGRTDLVVLSPRIKVLLNADNDTFDQYTVPGFRLSNHIAGVIDFDNDGDLDIYLAGYHLKDLSEYGRKGKILINQTVVSDKGVLNMPPDAPQGLSFQQDSLGIHLTWSIPEDDHTHQGMTYDVALYRDGETVTKGAHNPSSGQRTRLAPGRSTGKSTFNNLQIGTYTWRVQAIDGSFAASPFSPFGTFTYLPPPPIVNDTVIFRCGRTITLTALGENIEWYRDKNLTQLISTGTFHPEQTQRVYVVQNIDGYRGIPKHVRITIHEKAPAPTLNEANPVTVCEGVGGGRTLFATGTNVNWYTDEHVINLFATGNAASVPASAASYFVTQTIDGCQSDPLRVDVRLVTIESRIYYNDGNLWTMADDGDAFYWYKNGFYHAFTTVPYIPFDGETASYIVSVTKGQCQEISAPFISSEENITSVGETLESNVDIFPNPASSRVTLKTQVSGTSIRIFDTRGKLVHEAIFDRPGEQIIDTSQWMKGVYVIIVGDGSNGSARRLIVL